MCASQNNITSHEAKYHLQENLILFLYIKKYTETSCLQICSSISQYLLSPNAAFKLPHLFNVWSLTAMPYHKFNIQTNLYQVRGISSKAGTLTKQATASTHRINILLHRPNLLHRFLLHRKFFFNKRTAMAVEISGKFLWKTIKRYLELAHNVGETLSSHKQSRTVTYAWHGATEESLIKLSRAPTPVGDRAIVTRAFKSHSVKRWKKKKDFIAKT